MSHREPAHPERVIPDGVNHGPGRSQEFSVTQGADNPPLKEGLCPEWLSELGIILQTKISQVRFQVRAQAWAVGKVPGRGTYERRPIDVSLTHGCLSPSLLPSLPLYLKNK